MKPEELETLLKVCAKYGVQQIEIEGIKMVINPTLSLQQKIGLENMDRKDIEEHLYASV